MNLDNENEFKDLEVVNVKVFENGYDYLYDDFYVLPDNESSYWNELIELFH